MMWQLHYWGKARDRETHKATITVIQVRDGVWAEGWSESLGKGDTAEITIRLVDKTNALKKYSLLKKFYTGCYRSTEEGPSDST